MTREELLAGSDSTIEVWNAVLNRWAVVSLLREPPYVKLCYSRRRVLPKGKVFDSGPLYRELSDDDIAAIERNPHSGRLRAKVVIYELATSTEGCQE